MERVTIELTDGPAADALREDAAAHGRTVEEELAALVERTYAAQEERAAPPGGDNWVRELIELAKRIDLPDGIEAFIPSRSFEVYKPTRL